MLWLYPWVYLLVGLALTSRRHKEIQMKRNAHRLAYDRRISDACLDRLNMPMRLVWAFLLGAF